MSAKDLLIIRKDLLNERYKTSQPAPQVILFKRAAVIAAVAACFAFVVFAVMFPLQRRITTLETELNNLKQEKPIASDQDTQILITSVTASGQLQMPSFINELAPKGGQVRGANETSEFTLISPVATVVESNHPKFQWTPLASAQSYTVSIFDSDFHLIKTS